MEKTSKSTTTDQFLPPRAPFATDRNCIQFDSKKNGETGKEKVASEDYYRALKTYKEVLSNEKRMEKMNARAMSILLAGTQFSLIIFAISSLHN